MARCRSFFIGRTKPDARFTANECGLAFVRLGGCDGRFNGSRVVPINRLNDLPPISTKPGWRIVGEPILDLAVNRDSIIVIEAN